MLPPTLMIVADASLALELNGASLPEAAELYASDLGRRRAALLNDWDRLHQLRSAQPPLPAPSPRALRLDVETEALGALAVTLAGTAGPRAGRGEYHRTVPAAEFPARAGRPAARGGEACLRHRTP